MPPQVVPHDEAAAAVVCDVLAVGAFAGESGFSLGESAREIDAALDGALTKALEGAAFKGKTSEISIVPTLGRLPAQAIAVVGLGDNGEIDSATIRKAAGVLARRLGERNTVASTLHLEGSGDGAAAATEGFLLGTYRFTKYRSDPKPSKLERVLFLGATSTEEIERGNAVAEAVALARDLVNEPPQALTPTTLAERAREIADVGGLECTIFDEAELERRAFGGLLGVGRGSIQPPRFIHLRYAPEGATGKIALVGKGITFDSGGLSLKDAKNMETMKTDMAGSAAVLGAMSAVSRLGPKIQVDAYVSSSENMPGGNAIKPGDVITHFGGRTSEVLNTDAEGRLVLADALAWACQEKPAAIVDVATLTGAIMVALGSKAAGLFSNDEDLTDELIRASRSAGERLWAMPIYDDYRSDLDSEIADIKNTGSRYGGAIYGALFLRDFIGEGIPWAHIDIAGPARAERDYDEITRGGSGFGTRTLLAWIEDRAATSQK